jgi:hypothetical protein
MLGLSGMGGAGQGDFFVRQAIPVGNSALDQGQSLERLDGRTGKDMSFDVAQGQNRGAVGVDDGNAAPVARFDPCTAHDIDKKWIIHK